MLTATKVYRSKGLMAMVVPEQLPIEDMDVLKASLPIMIEMAQEHVWSQWDHSPGRPMDVEFENMEWFVTNHQMGLRDEFTPIHDCEDCRHGVQIADDYLRENPGRYVALVNIVWLESWPV